jgi:hypothetical protein
MKPARKCTGSTSSMMKARNLRRAEKVWWASTTGECSSLLLLLPPPPPPPPPRSPPPAPSPPSPPPAPPAAPPSHTGGSLSLVVVVRHVSFSRELEQPFGTPHPANRDQTETRRRTTYSPRAWARPLLPKRRGSLDALHMLRKPTAGACEIRQGEFRSLHVPAAAKRAAMFFDAFCADTASETIWVEGHVTRNWRSRVESFAFYL